MDSTVDYDFEWLGETGVNINHFFVPPEQRRTGAGSETLRRLLSQFENEGAEYVVVNMKGSDGAAEFLRQFGFEILEVQSDGHVTAEKEF